MMNIQRRFRILVMGAAFGLALATGQGHGGVQAERALAAVRELIDSGQIAPETVLHLVVKQGNIASFLGRGQTLQKEWERTTGILIDPRVMPQEDALEFLASESQTDLTIARAHEYPDLVHEGLIADLTPLFERFGFVLSEGREDGYILAQNQATFAGRIVAVPADGDVTILYLRKDLIDDVENQKRFREKYGKALSVPATWSEYQELIEFFHRPEAGFYGALEQREPSTGWMFWLSRYASQAVPNQYLFDEQMRPLINSPRGIAATKSYLATLPFSPPEILDPGNGYTFTLPLFMQGKGFSTIITIAGAKLFNLETSKIRGKFIAVPMPGEEIDNRVIRRPAMIYGNNIVIPKDSNHQVLAFLYAMWLTDPDVYRKMVGVPGGFADPFRLNHFHDQRIIDAYTPEALAVFRDELEITVPPGTGLPGEAKYIAALRQNLESAARGEISAEVAMQRTERAWDSITDAYGRDNQLRVWKAFRQQYPGVRSAALQRIGF